MNRPPLQYPAAPQPRTEPCCGASREVLPPVEFFVDIPSRHVIALTTPADTSIGFVKILVQENELIAFGRQRLLLNGEELDDADTIHSIGLLDGGLLQLVKNENHGTSKLAIDIFVRTLTGKTIPLRIPQASIPVITLKDLVRRKEGIPLEQQRLIFAGMLMEKEHALSDYNVKKGSTLHLVLKLSGGKPVIYLRSPVEIDATVRLSLIHDWRFSAVYPVVPTKRTTGPIHESVIWNVRTHTDGTMTETNTGLDVSYLFWEALTVPSAPMELTPPLSPNNTAPTEIFRPMECSFSNSDSVLMDVPKITPYLDRALKALGLDVEARTSFITYWLPDLLKHEHVALRFVPQASYSRAAPMDVNPIPDVVTRVFMVFRKVASDELGLWECARQRAHEDVDFWRDVVGVETRERQGDPTLFRVLEWGGMEFV